MCTTLNPKAPIGIKFGRWTVEQRLPNRHGKIVWQCRCDCGAVKEVYADNLRRGHSTSCGCYNLEQLRKGGRWGGHGKFHMWQTPEFRLWKKAQERARAWVKERNMPVDQLFNITSQDVFIPKTCPVLRIPLRSSEKKLSPNSPTLDRLNSNEGYIKGNIEVISHRANTLKSNATIEELELVIAYLRETSSRKGI